MFSITAVVGKASAVAAAEAVAKKDLCGALALQRELIGRYFLQKYIDHLPYKTCQLQSTKY
jgi:hypothetical protein